MPFRDCLGLVYLSLLLGPDGGAAQEPDENAHE